MAVTFSSSVNPISKDVQFVGKHIKTSKMRVVWSFKIRKAAWYLFEVELLASKSGKRRISVNGHLTKECDSKTKDQHTSFKFHHGGLALEVLQKGSDFDLLIGSQLFSEVKGVGAKIVDFVPKHKCTHNPDPLFSDHGSMGNGLKTSKPLKRASSRGSYPNTKGVFFKGGFLHSDSLTLKSTACEGDSFGSKAVNSEQKAQMYNFDQEEIDRESVSTASTVSPERFHDPFSSMIDSPFYKTMSTTGSTLSPPQDQLSGVDSGESCAFDDPFSSVCSSATTAIPQPPVLSLKRAITSLNNGAPTMTSTIFPNPFDETVHPNPFDETIHPNPFDEVVPSLYPSQHTQFAQLLQLQTENASLRLTTENSQKNSTFQHGLVPQYQQPLQQYFYPRCHQQQQYQENHQQQYQQQNQQYQHQHHHQCQQQQQQYHSHHHHRHHHQRQQQCQQQQQQHKPAEVSVRQLELLVANNTFDHAVMLALNTHAP